MTDTLMVGVSGVRGIVGKDLTDEVVMRYARAFGMWAAEHAPLVVVGRDARTSGPAFERAVTAGLGSDPTCGDRKSTRLNSSHSQISYAVFCLKKKKYWVNGFSWGISIDSAAPTQRSISAIFCLTCGQPNSGVGVTPFGCYSRGQQPLVTRSSG